MPADIASRQMELGYAENASGFLTRYGAIVTQIKCMRIMRGGKGLSAHVDGHRIASDVFIASVKRVGILHRKCVGKSNYSGTDAIYANGAARRAPEERACAENVTGYLRVYWVHMSYANAYLAMRVFYPETLN